MAEKEMQLIIDRFWDQCNWAYEEWIFTRAILDGNSIIDELKRKHSWFFNHLNIILQEYTLLQISKLHDPATLKNNENLSIDYIISMQQWDPEVRNTLSVLKERLDAFANPLIDARRKIIAHSDLKHYVQNIALGNFKENDDNEYFAALQEFVNVACGEVRPFCSASGADVRAFMSNLK